MTVMRHYFVLRQIKIVLVGTKLRLKMATVGTESLHRNVQLRVQDIAVRRSHATDGAAIITQEAEAEGVKSMVNLTFVFPDCNSSGKMVRKPSVGSSGPRHAMK